MAAVSVGAGCGTLAGARIHAARGEPLCPWCSARAGLVDLERERLPSAPEPAALTVDEALGVLVGLLADLLDEHDASDPAVVVAG